VNVLLRLFRQASWAGAKIIQEQLTADAIKLYELLALTFSTSDENKIADLAELKSKSGLNDTEWTGLIEYASQVHFSK
jgi:dipeptidyl-peptidase-3